MQQLDSLKEQGFRVKVNHLRFARPVEFGDTIVVLTEPNTMYQLRRRGFEPTSCGGVTIVDVVDPEGNRAVDIAVCCDEDHYNKKVGIAIALDRALGQFKEQAN